jgi:uncharacterized protein
MILTIKVKPKSKANELIYALSGTITVRITAAPESGKANDQLIKFLASIFETLQKNIEIISGKKSRNKIVKIRLPEEVVMKMLKQHIKET